mmetsp:Transcript_31136/g.69204  ORF Transcript_31136/g.69204 Transcript_31136/m.69204 type:complete len:363 (+) Transcript_31136:59-1147(+)
MADADLAAVASYLAAPGKGILAADESTGTIGKRLEKFGLENTEEHRRSYREVYATAPLGDYISGVILFKETLYQSTAAGKPFVDCFKAQGVYPGIKVDEGLQPLDGALEGETWTKGLDTLADSCKKYVEAGAKFAKWRATIKVQAGGPSEAAVSRNADDLAQYAKICQACGLVPIVEPEILIDGDHTIDRFQQVTERVVAATVGRLWHHGVHLEGSLLKPQMVIAGADYKGDKAGAEEIALRSITAFRRTVPAAIPGIMFLSGGQSEEEATLNLHTINTLARQGGRPCPWSLSFSYGRALQHSVLKLWAADQSKVQEAQAVAVALAAANSRASLGRYAGSHPSKAEPGSLYESFRGWSGAKP